MKRTFIDKVVGFFSPQAEARRIKARGKTELFLRAYDAAKTFSTDDWTSASTGSANTEIRDAQSKLRDKGRDQVRNNPYAGRALSAIVSNTVGAGIQPNIKGKSGVQTRKLRQAWREWGETQLCDANRKLNFYGLQSLVLKSTVESGEVLVDKEITREGHCLRLLESDHIATEKDSGRITFNKTEDTIQGVKLDKYGRPVSYWLYETHPGEMVTSLAIREVPAEKICHVYRQDRPGQVRGVSWFHSVIRQLNDFNEYQQATLISRKIGACFSAFITTNGDDSTLSAADLATKRANESMLSPATIKYLNQGESVTLATPPKIDGYDEYCRQTLRAIASGLGITYEALTSDYSQVNFSSGRMGHLEFRKNVELWRWQMLIPQFCEPAFKHFLDWCQLVKGIDINGVSVQWVPPAWSMIDPNKELEAVAFAIRNGLTSHSQAVREQGYDPEILIDEIVEDNKRNDEKKLIFDSDPRKTTKAGSLQTDPASQQYNGDNSSEENNQSPTDGAPQKSN